MKKIILILFIPIISLSQKNVEDKIKINNISYSSIFTHESNNLSIDFFKSMLLGGYISNEMKDNWISSGNNLNKFNTNLTNSFSYKLLNSKDKNKYYYFIFSDINNINGQISDDFMNLLFYGNYNFQRQNIDLSNTIIRGDRFQQYKFGYIFPYNILDETININIALSYLNGNQHSKFLINNGNIYTGNNGDNIELNYDLEYTITDTSDLSLFNKNGQGIAYDLCLLYIKDENQVGLNINDIGFIKWNNKTRTNESQENLNFSGVELTNFDDLDKIYDLIDSLQTLEIDSFSVSKNKETRSFIPGKLSLYYTKKLKNNIFKDIRFIFSSIWQPFNVNGEIDINLLIRGIQESGYFPSSKILTMMDLKYIYGYVGLSAGGFSNKITLDMSITNKKRNFMIGSYNIESIFNKEINNISLFLQLSGRI
tara:strand:+ start:109 stop:1383 length:1275 start_codon:yes stop_codon:yes gene_type:complete